MGLFGVDCNEVLLLRGNCQTENWIALRMHFISGAYVRRGRGRGGRRRGGHHLIRVRAPSRSSAFFSRVCFITDFYRDGAESAASSTLKRVSLQAASSSPAPPPPNPAARNRHHTVEISSVKCFVSPHRACGETQRSALVSALLRLTFSQKPSTLEGRL